jgi:hypothetical protein
MARPPQLTLHWKAITYVRSTKALGVRGAANSGCTADATRLR